MDKIIGILKVLFEEPFWIGLVEIHSDKGMSVCKITFGAEPKEGEVYDFILSNYFTLKFSPAVEAQVKEEKNNPKRMQREVRKQTSSLYIGTKSQQALKLQHEQMKIEVKQLSREQREEEKQRRFEQKQQKKRQKHKGH